MRRTERREVISSCVDCKEEKDHIITCIITGIPINHLSGENERDQKREMKVQSRDEEEK